MTTKADYNGEEWQLLLDVPPLVGTAVMVAGASGLGSIKEAYAVATGTLAMANQYPGNRLIKALLDGRLHDGDKAEVEKLTNSYRAMSRQELHELAIQKCRDANQLLSGRSTVEESQQYKEWTMAVGYHVAEAAKEGGFLGIGGERVSQAERIVLNDVAEALGIAAERGQ
ncbi:MAG: hypothetical protein R3E01_32090 [Pirellulaceae bacterium]